MSKKSSFIQSLLKPWQVLVMPPFFRGVWAVLAVAILVLGLSTGELIQTNLFGIQPAIAQRFSPGDTSEQVYQELPDFPKENTYISKETGKAATNNTLAKRLIQYHIYVKGRPPNFRLDWKLTLADYLGANEVMYDSTYPGNDVLRQNPIVSDRAAIQRLTRRQRDALVQVLTNLFNPKSENAPSQ